MNDYIKTSYKRATRREQLLCELNTRNKTEIRKHQAELFYQGYARDTDELSLKIYARQGARYS